MSVTNAFKNLLTVVCAVFCLGLTAGAVAGDYPVYPAPQSCLDQLVKEGKVLNIYDWAEWWPEELYTGFAEEYGIQIVRDNFADEDEMLAKFRLNPNLEYDIVLAGTRSFIQLKEIGIMQPLNHDWLPNVHAYLSDFNKNLPYDPGYRLGVPTDFYMIAYAFNTKYVDPSDPRIGSWKLLFEGDDFKNRITMLNDMFLTIGTALKYLGYSVNSVNPEALDQAGKLLMRQKANVMAYDAWPKRLMLEEEAWITHCWAGEAWYYHQDMASVYGALPEEGTAVGIDSLLIPKKAPHPAAAHLFMNYLFRPENMLKLSTGIGYPPPHTAALKMLPKEMQEWPGIDPGEDYLKKCEFISPPAFTGKGLKMRLKIWETLKQ